MLNIAPSALARSGNLIAKNYEPQWTANRSGQKAATTSRIT